jgi:hypothetical protein
LAHSGLIFTWLGPLDLAALVGAWPRMLADVATTLLVAGGGLFFTGFLFVVTANRQLTIDKLLVSGGLDSSAPFESGRM